MNSLLTLTYKGGIWPLTGEAITVNIGPGNKDILEPLAKNYI